MPRSSRHKSHKQSKHSSKEYSDAEEDVRKGKERTGKDASSSRANQDSTSGEKRKTSSQAREGRDRKDSSVHGNGEVLEEYVSSKRRKEKSDVYIDGDRWNGGEEKDVSDGVFGNDVVKGDSLKNEERHKEKSHKSENLKAEFKSKSKRNDSLVTGDTKEEGSAVVAMEKEVRSESKRKSDRDSSSRKERRDTKDKERRSDKERNGGQVSRNGDAEIKAIDGGYERKQGTSAGNLVEDRPSKRSRDNTDATSLNVLQNHDLEKENEKKIRRKREGSGERERHFDDSKEGNERHGSTRSERIKDEKHKDEKHKDVEKYQEDSHKSNRKKDEKHREDSDKDFKYRDEKFREDGEKDSKRRDYKYRDGERESRRKEEKYREDGDNDAKKKDDKYREVMEDRSGAKHKDGDRTYRCKDDRNNEDGAKDYAHGDDRYEGDRDRDDKLRADVSGDEGDNRGNKHKDEKSREDFERDVRRKDSNQGSEINREKKQRESKYEPSSRDRSGDKLDTKRSIDDGKPADYHARKSIAYDESPTHDYRAKRYRDDQNRRSFNDNEDHADTKPLNTKDQRSDTDRKSSKSSSDRARNASRHSDADHSSHSRRRSSPSSHGIRDNYRSSKQDDSKYRDYNHDERLRDSNPSTREHMASQSEKTASRSLEKLSQGNDSQQPEMPAERRLKSDNHSSPQQRSWGSRDWKEGRGSRDVGSNVVPSEEPMQVDADTLSVSSPFIKNSHFAGSSRPLPLPTPTGSAEDDGRTKFQSRNRRFGDPNMGRIPGNAWRGVPTWPSPMPNGFLPYPHPPTHVGFHPVMQPFPAPPMFGLRPPVDLNLHSPYHISGPDSYSGPGRPTGWPNQVDETCPPMHAWDGSGSLYGHEPHIYGRPPDWDQSQNVMGDDAWKGSNRTKSMERQSFEKENNSTRTGDEVGDQTQVEGLADIGLETKALEQNDDMVPLNSLEYADNAAKKARNEDVGRCRAYLLKLDISADLAEPELVAKFTSLLGIDQTVLSDVDELKFFYVEDKGSKMSSHSKLFPPMDNSIFQRCMFLYKKQKQEALQPKDEEKGDKETDMKSEAPRPTDETQQERLENGFPKHDDPEPNDSEKGENSFTVKDEEMEVVDTTTGKFDDDDALVVNDSEMGSLNHRIHHSH